MKPTNVRWGVVALLFFATTINYLDRTNLSVAIPIIAKERDWTPVAIGALSSAFLIPYTLLQLPIGALIDKIGTRLTYIWSVIVWSLASMGTAFGSSFGFMYVLRLILGIGESPCFPAAAKTVADWIPRERRGVSTGIVVAGVNMGSAIALPLVAWIVTMFGWKMSFIITGLIGLVWVAIWMYYYRDRKENKRVNAAEHALIEAGTTKAEEQPKVPWTHIFKRRSTWGLMMGYFCQVYVLYVFVSWLPSYLVTARHMSLLHSGIYGMIPFIAGTFSAFLGGRISDYLVRKTPNGRKFCMSLGLVLAAAIIPAAYVSSAGAALFLLTISEFGVMFSNGAAWAASSELAPAGQAGFLGSAQNFGGNIGGFLAPILTGFLLETTHSFDSSLVFAGIVALAGACFYYFLIPGSKTTSYIAENNRQPQTMVTH